MKKIKLLGLSCITFVMVGCEKVPQISQKVVNCNDPIATDLVKSTFQKSILNATKDVSNSNNQAIDAANLRATTNQIVLSLEDIRTSKKDPQSTKNFCIGTMKASIPADLIDKSNFVREHYQRASVANDAFSQNIELDANKVSMNLEYAVQPTDDGEKVFAELQNGKDVATFIAGIIVDASQKSNVQNEKAQALKDAAAVKKADLEKANQEKVAIATSTSVQEAATAVAQQAATEKLASVAAEKEQAKAQMDFKRREFNTLWKSATPAAQEAIADNQKAWVEKRDEICTTKAQKADPERQEIVRMQCVTKLLGERYYEVKKYFDENK